MSISITGTKNYSTIINSEEFKTNPDIVAFEKACDTDDITFSQTVKAYFARDLLLELDTHEQRVSYLNKLGYTPEKVNAFVARSQKEWIMNKLEGLYEKSDYEKSFSMEDMIKLYEKSELGMKVANEMKYRLERYNHLVKFLDESNHNFYEQCNLDELEHFGW